METQCTKWLCKSTALNRKKAWHSYYTVLEENVRLHQQNSDLRAHKTELNDLQKKSLRNLFFSQPDDHRQCCLCLAEIGGDGRMLMLSCGHFFEQDCFHEYATAMEAGDHGKLKCPLCRGEIFKKETLYF